MGIYKVRVRELRQLLLVLGTCDGNIQGLSEGTEAVIVSIGYL